MLCSIHFLLNLSFFTEHEPKRQEIRQAHLDLQDRKFSLHKIPTDVSKDKVKYNLQHISISTSGTKNSGVEELKLKQDLTRKEKPKPQNLLLTHVSVKMFQDLLHQYVIGSVNLLF